MQNTEYLTFYIKFFFGTDDSDEYFTTYLDLRNGTSRVTLTAYTQDLHEYADFSQRGNYVAFCVGNGKPGLDGNLTRLHILILAKISNYPVMMNYNGNLVFVPVVCKTANNSKNTIKNFRHFVTNLRLMFAAKNCYHFDDNDVETEFGTMSTIIDSTTTLRQ